MMYDDCRIKQRRNWRLCVSGREKIVKNSLGISTRCISTLLRSFVMHNAGYVNFPYTERFRALTSKSIIRSLSYGHSSLGTIFAVILFGPAFPLSYAMTPYKYNPSLVLGSLSLSIVRIDLLLNF